MISEVELKAKINPYDKEILAIKLIDYRQYYAEFRMQVEFKDGDCNPVSIVNTPDTRQAFTKLYANFLDDKDSSALRRSSPAHQNPITEMTSAGITPKIASIQTSSQMGKNLTVKEAVAHNTYYGFFPSPSTLFTKKEKATEQDLIFSARLGKLSEVANASWDNFYRENYAYLEKIFDKTIVQQQFQRDRIFLNSQSRWIEIQTFSKSVNELELNPSRKKIEDSELKKIGEYGYTMLQRAAFDHDFVTASNVLNSLFMGGAYINQPDESGWTAVHIAARYEESFNILFLLVAKYQADINLCTSTNSTPLHIAVSRNNLDAVKLLIKYKANLNIQTRRGLTPLHSAVRNGYVEMAKILVECGANLYLTTAEGKTALDLIPVGKENNFQFLRKVNQNIDMQNRKALACYLCILVTQTPFVINKKLLKQVFKEITSLECTLLHDIMVLPISLSYKKDIINLGIKHGMPPNAVNQFGQVLFHVSAKHFNNDAELLEIFKILYENNCEENVLDASYQTPLHIAVAKGMLNTACYLIKTCNANPYIENIQGKTALDLIPTEKTVEFNVFTDAVAEIWGKHSPKKNSESNASTNLSFADNSVGIHHEFNIAITTKFPTSSASSSSSNSLSIGDAKSTQQKVATILTQRGSPIFQGKPEEYTTQNAQAEPEPDWGTCPSLFD